MENKLFGATAPIEDYYYLFEYFTYDGKILNLVFINRNSEERVFIEIESPEVVFLPKSLNNPVSLAVSNKKIFQRMKLMNARITEGDCIFSFYETGGREGYFVIYKLPDGSK